MVAAYVQTTTGTSTSTANNPTMSFGSATGAAGLIVACAVDDSGTVNYVTGISDNKGSTYTRLLSAEYGSTGSTLHVFAASNVAGGASHTLTVGWTGSGSSTVSFMAQEFSGVATSSPLDKSTAIATGTSVSPLSATTAATTQADEIVIGVFGHEGATATRTAGSGFSGLAAAGGTGFWLAMESKVVAATGTQSAGLTLSASRAWGAACFTFKAAGAAAVNTGAWFPFFG